MEKKRVKIFDTTLRDGEQAPGASLTPEEKIRLAKQLAKLGVDVIEPGFPVSSPGEFMAVREISRQLQEVEICGFARAVKEDIDKAVQATEDAARRRLHLFISSSDIHLDFQLRKSRDQVIRIAREKVAYAKQFVDEIEFSPMDASRTGIEFLLELVEAVIAEGATIINIPDTVGYALPDEFGRMIAHIKSGVRGADLVQFSAHCHNDLGLAVANSLVAIQAGVTQVEVTVNGVGERAGNCSLEELVMAIETRKDALGLETGIRTAEIYNTSRMVSRLMKFPIAFNKPIVGRNAFQHESGIHQDGLLKNRRTYEIMDPESIGIPHNMIILGKHSGRHALKHRVEQFGIALTEQQLDDLYARFKETADRQKIVTDEQLLQLVGMTAEEMTETVTVLDMQIADHRNRKVAVATVQNHMTGEERTYTGIGSGPVEAAIVCLKQAIPLDVEFEDLELYSLSAGESASGEAAVTIFAGGKRFKGTSIDNDIIQAAVKAFMIACNQALRESAVRGQKAKKAGAN